MSASSAPPARVAVLRLYRRLLQQGGQFADYNFRETARRQIRDKFRAARHVEDVNALSSLYARGEAELQVLRRQVLVQNLYHQQPYVIEQQLQLRPYRPRTASGGAAEAAGGGAGPSSPAPPPEPPMTEQQLAALQRSHEADKR